LENKLLNILAVDDDREVLTSLCKSLSRVGHKCNLFNNAIDALELYKTKQVDVVITDIQMPDMNGIEFISLLYKHNKDVKIIIITVLEDFELIENEIKNRVIAYYDKPVNFYNLINTLDEIENEMESEGHVLP
jgi:two-component system response regulator YesN